MKVRAVCSLRDFDELAPAWHEITTEAKLMSPFVSHDWFACCWRTAGPNRRREVWVVEDAAGPLAVIPLVWWRDSVRRVPVRIVRLLDAPDSPIVDLPVAREREQVVRTFFGALGARRDWDLLVLPRLREDSETLAAMREALRERFPWRVAGVVQSPYVSIRGSWDDFFRATSQRFRKTCRSVENRLRRLGTITVEEHSHVEPDSVTFTEVMDVSRASWKGPRGLAMATMEGMPRFFRELTVRASANGWLNLSILRLDGRAIATEYQIRDNGCRHALRADFDAAFAATSPGAYLNQHIIRTLFERGAAREYDMGPGTNEYKLRWATGAHTTVALEVYNSTARGRLLQAIDTHLVPLRQRLSAEGSTGCA